MASRGFSGGWQEFQWWLAGVPVVAGRSSSSGWQGFQWWLAGVPMVAGAFLKEIPPRCALRVKMGRGRRQREGGAPASASSEVRGGGTHEDGLPGA